MKKNKKMKLFLFIVFVFTVLLIGFSNDIKANTIEDKTHEEEIFETQPNIIRPIAIESQNSNNRAIIGGADERQIVNPNLYSYTPYCMICKIVVNYVFDSTQHDYYGTGFLVTPSKILTSYHVAYDKDYGPFNPYTIKFYFEGYSSTPITGGQIIDSGDYSFVNKNTEEDWALIDIGYDVGYSVGWFGLSTYATTTTNKSITVTGYPYNYYIEGAMLRGKGDIKTIYYLNYYGHDADTTSGQSGSPVYSNSYICNGIHCRFGVETPLQNENFACRINPYIVSVVNSYLPEED